MSKHLSAAFFILSFFLFFNITVHAAILPTYLNELSNTERSKADLNTLKISDTLTRSAQAKADDMAAKNYFEHTSPDGRSFFYWIDQAGYKYTMAGENLAVYFAESGDVVEAWMNSPGHKENILRTGFTEVGSAVAEGVYQGQQTVFVVQHYGSPSEASSQVSVTPAPAQIALQPAPQPPSASIQTQAVASLKPPVVATSPAPQVIESRVASRRKSVETTKPIKVQSFEISSVPVVAGGALAYGADEASEAKEVITENIPESTAKQPEQNVLIGTWRIFLHRFIDLIRFDKLFR